MSYSVSDIQESRLFDWSELITLGHALGHKWWMIGTKLRVPEAVLDQIAANNGDAGDCGACLLREWLTHDPIWSELITVLETPAVGLGEVAGKIRMKLVHEASKGQSNNKTIAHSSPATARNQWEQPLDSSDDENGARLVECCVKCQALLDSQDSDQWEKGIEESSRGINMCRDSNPSVSGSNEVAMTLHLMRAKLMWKLVTLKQSKEMSKWHQLEKCLLDCEEVIHMARCDPKYSNTEYEGVSLAYQCGLVKGDDRVIQQYRRSLMQRGTSRAVMLQLERAALEDAGNRSYKTRVYHLQEMLFPKVSFIEQPLLEDVIRCYKERQTVCRNCFYNDLKLSRGFNAKGQCTRCQWEFKKLLVIPKSPLTVNYYKSEMIAIPPWPKSKPNELPFESCAKPTDKSQEHKRCLVMSRNSAVWYAHTVEELVIWTVEREYGCTFEEFIQQRGMPFAPFMPPIQPPSVPPPPHAMRPLPPGMNPTNQGAPQQPHPPVGSKPPAINNRAFTRNHISPPVNHGNSWSPWSNDLEFLAPPTTSHSTRTTSPLKQIWSQPDHMSLDALQNTFTTMSLDTPSSKVSHNTWDVSLPSSNNMKWSDGWSSNPSAAGMDPYSQRSSSYYNGSSGYLSRPLSGTSTLLARGTNSDVKALSRPRSALYHPLHVKFSSVANIPRELLQSVCTCFSHRQRVCQTCFISTGPTNENDLLKISRQNGPCYNCGQSVLPILVMPTSSLCVNMTMFIPVLPCPANATCIKCCPNTATCHDQQCCFAHSVEELVIWCVELESGRMFEEVFEQYLSESYNSRVVGAPMVKRYTLASVIFKNRNDVPKDLLFRVLDCYHMRVTVCKACFYKFRPQTEIQLESFQPLKVRDQLVCGSCNQSFSGLLVMPSCTLCENNYGNYVPIATKGQNSPVHSVEELVLKLMDGKISVDPFNNI